MKKLFISFVALATLAVGMVSCNSKNGSYQIVVEPQGADAFICMPSDAVVSWNNTMVPEELAVSYEQNAGKSYLQIPEELKTDGVRRFLYPVAAYAGEGKVSIPTLLNTGDYRQVMPVYAELVEGSDSLNFVWLCGVVCVHLTTGERLSSVSISTDDSLNYLSGLFAVNNYPNPELVVADGVGGEKSVRCENLSEMDFSQGGDVYFYVAPGVYHTFTVTMTAADGRVCVKSQKEDMVVEVNRNNVTTIMAGSADHKLVFE